MQEEDDFGGGVPDAPAGGDVIPFPKMRPNAKLSEVWSRERASRNDKNHTNYAFRGPLDALDDIIRKRSMPALPWPSAWPQIGRRARAYAGDCIGVVGPKGGGKTSFAIQVGLSCNGDGIPVIWAPLELDESQITTRIVANMHGVHTAAIREHWPRERIAHSLNAVHDMWKFVDRYAEPERQIDALLAAISMAKSVYRVPPLLVIDYLGKLAVVARDIRLATIQAAEAMRAAAVREECYVMLLAQGSRGGEPSMTGRADVETASDAIGFAGESSEIEAACRVMTTLAVYKQDDAEVLKARALVGKTNGGGEGQVGMEFQKAGGVWSELDHLPATPNEGKAKLAEEKKNKHRPTVPTLSEVTGDINTARASDAATGRRGTLVEHIKRHGALGMDFAAMRKLSLGRSPDVQQALQELERSATIEKTPAGRWRMVTRKL